MRLSFTKMQGCGNDYIYLDCRETGVPDNIAALCTRLSPRHLAVGADGIICICAPETPGADGTMRMFNADGSEGKMCGNGIRCVAQWLRTHVPALAGRPVLAIDTRSGRKTLTARGDGLWQVEMGRYSAMAADLPAAGLGAGPLVRVPLTAAGRTWTVSCISVGNPHCVTVVPDVGALRLDEIGPAFETHPAFPERVNTEFVQVVDAAHLKMRVWERGSGETWACGTGTCAAVAAMVEQGICARETDVQVQLLGGTLTIRVTRAGELLMTGPAVTVYEGTAEV
jgi:diaminopimelate epimerase